MARPTKVTGLGPWTPLAEAASKLVSARLGDVERLANDPSRGSDPDVLHDLRVAIRRLRVALDLFERSGDPLAGRAKELQDALGAVRDLQVEIAWLESIAELGAEGQALVAERREEALEQLETLGQVLAGWPAVTRFSMHALRSPGGRLGGKKMRRALRRLLREVDKRVAALQRGFNVRGVHRARIAVKKLRYAGELLAPAFPVVTATLEKSVLALQRHLGDMHDADVWSDHWSREVSHSEGSRREAAQVAVVAAASHRRKALASAKREVARWDRARLYPRARRALKK